MSLTLSIILAWLALQLPLGMLIGKSIKLGMGGASVRGYATRDRGQYFSPAR